MSEKSFVKIPMEIVNALSGINMSAYETRLFFYIARHTFGWHNEMMLLKKSRVAKALGVNKQNLNRTLKKLCARYIIEVTISANGTSKIGIQPRTSLWLDKVPLQRTLDFAAESTTKYKEGVK